MHNGARVINLWPHFFVALSAKFLKADIGAI